MRSTELGGSLARDAELRFSCVARNKPRHLHHSPTLPFIGERRIPA